jgi:hypothetical protein
MTVPSETALVTCFRALMPHLLHMGALLLFDMRVHAQHLLPLTRELTQQLGVLY